MSRITIVILGILLALGASRASAQTAENDNSAVYLYGGADRGERLIARAREEGSLTLYTSMAPTESGLLAQTFQQRYGVKVALWRALSESVLQRTLTEARGRRRSVDVIETNATEVEALARERLVAQFDSPYLADLPDWAIPSHRRWFSDRATLWVTGYNTTKLKREELPQTLTGFLDSRWKGDLALEAADFDWMHSVVAVMGEERGLNFFRKLSEFKPQMRKGHVLLAQLVAAGELTVSPTIYSSNVTSIQSKGGPIDFVIVEPLIGRPQALALAASAPHPHAALLFADFVFSPEGMKLLNDMGRTPSSRTQQTLLNGRKYFMVGPMQSADSAQRWEKLWNELFLK
ncbi:MAG: extracellular solute-binding protein [Acidobacteriaceae bacterium]|nr:extracellular solute-binding protein [Acidobacteriaceae bacterium]